MVVVMMRVSGRTCVAMVMAFMCVPVVLMGVLIHCERLLSGKYFSKVEISMLFCPVFKN